MNVLVTGGTGHLGRAIVTRLDRDGHQVRVLARHPGSTPGIDWIKGDLATGEGVREAVAGVEVVVHAATNSPAARRGRFRPDDFVRSPADVDVVGTSDLLAAAEREGVGHCDSDEFADHVVASVADGRSGVRPDFAGPEDLTLIELMEQYLDARGLTRPIHRVRGTTRWSDWLARPAMPLPPPPWAGSGRAW